MNDVDCRLGEVRAGLIDLISEPDTWEKAEKLEALIAELKSIEQAITKSLPDDTKHTQAGG